MAKNLNINLSFTADTAKAKAQMTDLQRSLDNLIRSSVSTKQLPITDDLVKAQSAAASLKVALESAFNTQTGKLDISRFSESMKKANLDAKTIRIELDKLGPAGQQAFLSLAQSVMQADAPLRRTNALVSELWTTMKNTVRWQISSSVLHGFMGTISSAYRYAQDLDESLNNIRIVTGQSTDQMAKFAENANRAAKALGTTTTAYTNAALIYYQQGDDDSTVLEKTDITTKMANVTGQNATVVSDQLTAIWNNFNKSGEESYEKFADILTKLGAETASSTDEIAGGLEKFASIADMIGLSYEYAASALTTITAVTRQSEDVVGTALKTIFARIQGLKLGDTLEDGTDLNKYSQALQSVGISIKDQNGELKDMDIILQEMGAKWQTLSKDQQVALAQTVAGVRQYNQLVSLMDNWDFMESNLELAENATGTLDEQADIYAESWEAARKRVTDAAQDIYDSILDEKFFIGILNGFEDILSVVGTLVDSLGGLPGILSALGLMFTKVFNQQLVTTIDNLAYGINSMTGANLKNSKDTKESYVKQANKINYNDGTQAGEARNASMHNQIDLQNKMLQYEHMMSDTEKARLQTLLDINKAYGEQAIKAAEVKDAASDKLQEEGRNFTSRIKRDGGAHGYDVDDFKQVRAANQEQINGAVQAQKALEKLNAEYANTKDLNAYQKGLKKVTGTLGKFGLNSAVSDLTRFRKELQTGKKDVSQFSDAVIGYAKDGDILAEATANADTRIRNLGDGTLFTDKEIEQFSQSQLELAQKSSAASDAVQAQAQHTERLKLAIAGVKGAADSFAQRIVGVSQGLMSLTMGINALKAIGDVLKNDDMPFGEKLLSITMSLSMAIPALISAMQALSIAKLKSLKEDLVQLGIGATKLAQTGLQTVANWAQAKSEQAVAAGKKSSIIATIAQTAANWALNASMGPLLAVILLITAAVAGLVAIAFILVKAFQAWKASTPEGKLKALEERAEKSADAFNRVKESVNSTLESLDKLVSTTDTLDDLTKGTEAWNKAVQEINAQVLELLDKYPEIANMITRTEDGVLGLSNEGYETIRKIENDRLSAAQNIKLSDERDVIEQKISNNRASEFKAGNLLTTDLNRTTISNPRGGGNYTTYNGQNDIKKGLEDAYSQMGDSMFTETGAEVIAEILYDKDKYTQEQFDEIINKVQDSLEANKEYFKENAALKEQAEIISNMQLETKAKQFGSNRSGEEISELLGGNGYDDILEASKSKVTAEVKDGGFGDWNDHINYSKNDKEWGMIEDFMNLQGDNVEYVAQRWGKMVLEVDGKEVEFTKDEVYDALAELYSGEEMESRLQAAFSESLGNALGGVDLSNAKLEDLTSLDNFRNSITDALAGTAKEGVADQVFKSVVGAYGTTDENGNITNITEDQLSQFSADTEYIDFSSVENLREFTGEIEKLSEGKITVDEFTQSLKEMNAAGQIDSMESFFKDAAKGMGLDDEAAANMQEYAKNLMEVSKDSDELADSLASDADSAADLAVEVTRMNRGVDKLADGFEDWNSVLKNSDKTSAEYSEAMAGMKDALGDVLDVESDLISSDFVEGHLEDIQKAAKGDEEAIDRLRSSMDEEIIANITLGQNEDFVAMVTEKENLLKAELDRVNTEIPNIEVGAIIDDTGFIDAANNLVEQAGMTADEANAYFAGIGYEPVYSTEDIENANSMQSPNAKTDVTMAGISWSEENIKIGEHELPIKAPTFHIETKSTPLPATDAKANMRLTSFSGDGKPPQIKGLRKKATGSMNNYSSVNAGGKSPGSGGGKGGGKGGGGNSPKPNNGKKKNFADERERYHEIERSIDKTTAALTRLELAKDRAFGANKIKAIDAEIAAQKTLYKQYKDLTEEARKYAEADKNAFVNKDAYMIEDSTGKEHTIDASAKGYLGMDVLFNEYGEIDNYDELMKAAVNKYNAAVVEFEKYTEDDESAKVAFEIEEAKYERFMELMKTWEDSETKYIESIAQAEEQLTKIQELNLEKITTKFENNFKVLERELKSLQLTFDLLADDVYKAAEALEFGLIPQFDNIKSSLATTKEEINELNAAFNATNPEDAISETDYYEMLGECADKIEENIRALKDYDDQMREYYGNTLDMAMEEIGKYISQMEHLASVVEHLNSVLELTGESKDYKKMDTLLQASAKLAKDKYLASKSSYEMLKEQREDLEKDLLNAVDDNARKVIQDNLDKVIEQMNEAEDQMLSDAEAYGEKLNEILSNAMAKAADEMEKALSNGMGFEELNNSISRLSSNQDEYLTKTNQIYEANKMMHTLQQDIDKTTNAASKQKLASFAQEIEALKESNQLSNLELEIAKAKYAVLQAQIALEEAQQAKSTVRLKRDAEGNYGYVYSADDTAISDAQQQLMDAENDLYNIRLEATNDYGQKKLQAEQDFANALMAIDQKAQEDAIYRETQYQADRARIISEYTTLIQTYSNLYAVAQEDDSRVVADAWVNAYGTMISDGETWKTATSDYVTAIDSAFSTWNNDMDFIRREVGTDLNTLADRTKDLTDESEKLRDKIVDEVVPAMDSELTRVRELTTEYANNRTALLNLIEEYKNYLELLNAKTNTAQVGFDKNTDYSVLMNEYLNNGGKVGDATYNQLLAQRDAKIEWLKSDAGGNKTEEYWGTSGTATTALYQMLQAGGGTAAQQAWFTKDYMSNDKLIEAFDKINVALDEKVVASLTKVEENVGKVAEAVTGQTEATKTLSDTNKEGLDGVAAKAETGLEGVTTKTEAGLTGLNERMNESKAAMEDALAKNTLTLELNTETMKASLEILSDTNAMSLENVSSSLSSGLSMVASAVGSAGRFAKVTAFDSGGYTGQWGEAGKLAMLHEKELVLNATDTENILQSVQILRSLSAALDANARYASYTGNLTPSSVGSTDGTLQQEVHIEASFPGVTDHNEIELALDNLINSASQYANRK